MVGAKYNPLSEEEINLIHSQSLRVLEEIGIKAAGTAAFDVFKKAGANTQGNIVKISRSMVKDALESTPSKVMMYGRDDKYNLALKERDAHLGTGGAALSVIDIDSKEPRTATLKDIMLLARLVNKLDHIEFYLRPVVAQDIPKEVLDINKYYASMLGTTKHVMGSAYSSQSLEQVIKLASIIAGSEETLRSKPFVSFITCWMKSPLALDPHPTGLMMEIVKKGLPVVLSSAPMAGSTAPVTLSGCLVQLHAEMLSGVVLTQLINPGAPVIYGYVPSIANPMTMDYIGGAAEFGLLNASAVQIAAYFGMPNYSSAGLTESKVPDAQAGIEKALSVLQVAQAGGNYIHHAAGMLESMLSVSYAQYVIDNDILGMTARILKGVEVNDEKMAFDVIAKVGPGGNYISQKHTAKNVRKEYFFPKVMDRSLRKEWKKKGSCDLWQKANDQAKEILSSAQEPLIPAGIDSRIRKEFNILIKDEVSASVKQGVR
ncbi:trimethylamine methyltransferase family protein [Elusimicrobiota bacterium]